MTEDGLSGSGAGLENSESFCGDKDVPRDSEEDDRGRLLNEYLSVEVEVEVDEDEE